MAALKTKDGKYALKYKHGFADDVEIVECGTDKTFSLPGEALLFLVGEGFVKPHLKDQIDKADAIKLLT